MDRDVSTLQEHELRSVRAHKEQDFTRWLAEHIEWLGSALAIELEDWKATVSREGLRISTKY